MATVSLVKRKPDGKANNGHPERALEGGGRTGVVVLSALPPQGWRGSGTADGALQTGNDGRAFSSIMGDSQHVKAGSTVSESRSKHHGDAGHIHRTRRSPQFRWMLLAGDKRHAAGCCSQELAQCHLGPVILGELMGTCLT